MSAEDVGEGRGGSDFNKSEFPFAGAAVVPVCLAACSRTRWRPCALGFRERHAALVKRSMHNRNVFSSPVPAPPLMAMPTAAASRVSTDIAELVVPQSKSILPGKPTDMDEPPEPLENGEPRRWAEFGVAATSVIYIGLIMVPWELKMGQAWYTAAHSLVLVSAILSVACLFWGNTHIKIIRFLSGNLRRYSLRW